MRLKHAFPRARLGDLEARAVIARRYEYLAPKETVEATLEEFDGALGDLADWLRHLQANPPSGEPLATAIVAPQQWNAGAALSYRNPPPKKATQEEPAGDQEVAETEQPQEVLSPTTGTAVEETLAPDTGPEPAPPAPEAPSAPVVEQETPRSFEPTAPSAPTPRTKPLRAVPLTRSPPVRRVRSSSPATTAIPTAAYRRVVDVALSIAPKWSWPLFGCLHLQIAEGQVVVFSRADACAFWICMRAETTGTATAAVPRPGASLLRRVAGSGPVELSIFDDRVMVRRDSEPVLAPSRPGAVPAIPEIDVRGGLVVARETLAPALDIEREEVLLSWDGRQFLVGGQPVDVRYGSGRTWETRLDSKLLLGAVARGSEAMLTIEIGNPTDPVILTSGNVTAALAPRHESYL